MTGLKQVGRRSAEEAEVYSSQRMPMIACDCLAGALRSAFPSSVSDGGN